MRRMRLRSSTGICGRPGLAFQRQNWGQPARGQRIIFSGRTTTRAPHQSNSREQERERQPCRGIDSSGPDAALLEQRKLAAEKWVPGFHRSPRSERERNQTDKVSQQSNDDLKESDDACDHVQQRQGASNLFVVADRALTEFGRSPYHFGKSGHSGNRHIFRMLGGGNKLCPNIPLSAKYMFDFIC